MQRSFSKESHKAEVVPITIEATSETMSLCHLRISSTLCSSGTSREAELHSPKDSNLRDSNEDRGRLKKQTWAFFSNKCFPCFFSYSSRFSPVCSLEASFRTALCTTTTFNALTTLSSSLSLTESAKSTMFLWQRCVISATTKDLSNSWIKK